MSAKDITQLVQLLNKTDSIYREDDVPFVPKGKERFSKGRYDKKFGDYVIAVKGRSAFTDAIKDKIRRRELPGIIDDVRKPEIDHRGEYYDKLYIANDVPVLKKTGSLLILRSEDAPAYEAWCAELEAKAQPMLQAGRQSAIKDTFFAIVNPPAIVKLLELKPELAARDIVDLGNEARIAHVIATDMSDPALASDIEGQIKNFLTESFAQSDPAGELPEAMAVEFRRTAGEAFACSRNLKSTMSHLHLDLNAEGA